MKRLMMTAAALALLTTSVTNIASSGPLDDLERMSPDQIEAAVTATLTYNVICKDVTPQTNERVMMTILMFAKIGGVDITNPTTLARIKRQGETLIIGVSLDLVSRSDYCRTLYGTIAKMEKIVPSS